MVLNQKVAPCNDSGKRLFIELGSQMLVTFEGEDINIQGEFIGMKVNEYLIVKIPASKPQSETLLHKNAVIKYPQQMEMYGFHTDLISAIHQPDALLFFKYPKDIINYNIRQSTRIDCYLPGVITIDEVKMDCEMINISTGGCLCRIDNTVLANTHQIEIAQLSIQKPDNAQQASITGYVRSIKQSEDYVDVGLIFTNQGLEFRNLMKLLIPNLDTEII